MQEKVEKGSNIVDFINRVLGIPVVYKNEKPNGIPNYIRTSYRLQKVTLDGNEAIFLYPKMELDAARFIKGHIEQIQNAENVPVILIPEQLTYRQREALLREHIPFVVDGKQIYLPFMALYLQERCDAEKQIRETLLPSAQLLLLYYIYRGCGELLTSQAALDLDFTPTSISRASRQLEELGLLHSEKRGVQKILYSEKLPEELFNDAGNYLRNPVKRIIYVPKSEIQEELPVSSYRALYRFSDFYSSNYFPPTVDVLATDSIAKWEKLTSKNFLDEQEQCIVELWRYDPRKLSSDGYVDRLSLALSLRDDGNEDIPESVDDMLAQVWRDIDINNRY